MKNKIREIVMQTMPDKNLKLTDNAGIISELGFDSIAMIALISSLEEEFGISFDDEDLDLCNFSSITVITDTVRKYYEKN